MVWTGRRVAAPFRKALSNRQFENRAALHKWIRQRFSLSYSGSQLGAI